MLFNIEHFESVCFMVFQPNKSLLSVVLHCHLHLIEKTLFSVVSIGHAVSLQHSENVYVSGMSNGESRLIHHDIIFSEYPSKSS